MNVTRNDAMRIIGTRGATATNIRKQSGAQVKADPEAIPCCVKVTGPLAAVDTARSMILDVLADGTRAGPSQWDDEAYVRVTQQVSKKIKDQNLLKKVTDDTWAKVEFGREWNGYALLKLEGEISAVARARTMLIDISKAGSGTEPDESGTKGQKRKWGRDSWNGGQDWFGDRARRIWYERPEAKVGTRQLEWWPGLVRGQSPTNLVRKARSESGDETVGMVARTGRAHREDRRLVLGMAPMMAAVRCRARWRKGDVDPAVFPLDDKGVSRHDEF